VIFEGGRVYGDGVNVASRIRPLAEPGGVAVSEPVFDAVKNQAGVELTPLGTHELKNVARPLAVYAVTGSAATPARTLGSRSALRRAAALPFGPSLGRVPRSDEPERVIPGSAGYGVGSTRRWPALMRFALRRPFSAAIDFGVVPWRRAMLSRVSPRRTV